MPDSAPRSHVFIIRGDITNLACDAWLLPSDSRMEVADAWLSAVPDAAGRLPAAARRAIDRDEILAARLDTHEGDPVPILTTVPLYGVRQTDDLRPAVRAFIEAGAAAPHYTKRPTRLLAMPFFGAQGGGGSALRGDILRVLLDEAGSTAERLGVDVALVLRDEKAYALAQHVRRTEHGWEGLDHALVEKARTLGDHAKAGRLVPFMGSGVSVSAGAPVWSELLRRLAHDAGLDDVEREQLSNRDPLDQAALLRAAFEARDGTAKHAFSAAVAQHVERKRYGLAPALLASLDSEQAITLNYDTLFEQAARDAGRPRIVLPDESSVRDDWLLKLHGSVTNPETIVLTRDDYLGFNSGRAALSALVKATLMTRHLLFVGFGLRDDHFHEIAHDVQRAVDGKAHLGTVLTLASDPLDEKLWQGRLDFISMSPSEAASMDPSAQRADAARKLEIFLDIVLAYASDGHSYLLDPDFAHALTPAELHVRDLLMRLARDADESAHETAAWARVDVLLGELGAERITGSSPTR
ncbi:SIR2 family NAD-dependent protein deacylase [Agromyces laixinhei]|uniref:SIR2 family NAD-dependent protein deacylase n=1 Tax=Agromyces laixinhei TaxID=2585717 RepID=UPI0011170E79|nr:SIR2 family protein [Agromyces laixinhei]